MSASDIRAQTLHLNGVFARLQAGKYNVQQAVTDALTITDNIDKYADTLESQATSFRKQIASFAKTNYSVNQELVKIKSKNEALTKQLKSCKDEFSQYIDFFSEEEKEMSFTSDENGKKKPRQKHEDPSGAEEKDTTAASGLG